MMNEDVSPKKETVFEYKLPNQKNMQIFNYEKFKKSRDILSLAFGIFELEKELKKCKISKYWIERYISFHNDDLKKHINELVSYVLLENINIQFYYSEKKLKK